MKKKPTAVGANIFAGGFTLGVSKHFDVLAHLEHDDYGVEVSKANFPGLKVFTSVDEWPKEANKKIDFLYSNPPCAIWSLAGNKVDRGHWRNDPRLQRIEDIFELVDRYRPAVWCWESVCQAFERGREFVEELADRAKAIGYTASYVLIDAQYLRAPQTRKRFFLVLHRVAIDWDAARPDFNLPPVLPRDVLKGVKPDGTASYRFVKTEIGKQMDKILKATPPGGRLGRTFEDFIAKGKIKHVKTERGTTLGKPSFLAYRIDPDKLCGVVFGDKTFHHEEPRHLALNELGVLHGFPPTYNWVGNHHRLDIQRGVLPPVAEWLARTVARAIERNVKIKPEKDSRTLVDFRKPPGFIGPVSKLPEQIDLDWKPGKLDAEQKKIRKDAEKFNKEAPRDAVKRLERVRAKTAPIDYDKLSVPPAFLAFAKKGSYPTSGELIRAALQEKIWSDETIAAGVRKIFTGRKTTTSDINWNRAKLKKESNVIVPRIHHYS